MNQQTGCKKMKSFDFLWWFIGGAFVGSLLFGNILSRPWKAEDRSLQERLAIEEKIKKQFDSDFAFIPEWLNQRDTEIYMLAEKWDRDILAKVECLASTTNTNDYRAKLETDLKWWLNHHIEDCVRIQSRLREKGRSFRSAHFPCTDIYDTKCDCQCCEKD